MLNRVRAAIALFLLALPSVVAAQSYTISPSPFQVVLNNAGLIVNNACVWTYVAGSSTPATTYSDNAGTANSNPIRSDSAGRFTAYLLAGSAYKFVYEGTCTPPAHGTILRTADNISGIPSSAATVDATGVAGETISAGQCAYLSDGSGSKTATQWFKCDSAAPYSSTTLEVGIAPSAIISGATGTIRLSGPVSGLSSLSAGSFYYVGTAGALTTTAPSNNPRKLGFADSATTLILNGNPNVQAVDTTNCNGRLTLTTAVPITTADVTAATTLYWTPYKGGQCALYDGTYWTLRSFTELSIAVPATTSQMYDVWLYDSSGTLALELLAWTNDTTRATALTTQNGVYVKTGATTRRYLGSFRTTAVSGQTEDSKAKRYVWNFYNRTSRLMERFEATASWAYTTAVFRQANGAAANQVDFVIGVADVLVEALLQASVANTNPAVTVSVGLGLDSTTVLAADQLVASYASAVANVPFGMTAVLRTYPAIGRHVVTWLELSQATGTSTWSGVSAGVFQCGIIGSVQG